MNKAKKRAYILKLIPLGLLRFVPASFPLPLHPPFRYSHPCFVCWSFGRVRPLNPLSGIYLQRRLDFYGYVSMVESRINLGGLCLHSVSESQHTRACQEESEVKF